MRSLLLAVGMALLFASPAKAWNATGHQIVAALAWRELTPEARKQTSSLLRQHPAYAASWQREVSGQASEGVGPALFLRAADWPDEVRTPGNPYDHAPWHFIAHPYVPSEFRNRFHPADDGRADSLIEEITLRQDALRNAGLPGRERAIALAWLIFLIGEAHQPLSCVTRISPAFPHSDHNGHDLFVRIAKGTISLHDYWDALPGTVSDVTSVQHEAARIARAYPRSCLAELTAHEPEAWGWESAGLAEKVYRKGKLRGSSSPHKAPVLSHGYAREAHSLADRQMALASYRLADTLNALFAAPPDESLDTHTMFRNLSEKQGVTVRFSTRRECRPGRT